MLTRLVKLDKVKPGALPLEIRAYTGSSYAILWRLDIAECGLDFTTFTYVGGQMLTCCCPVCEEESNNGENLESVCFDIDGIEVKFLMVKAGELGIFTQADIKKYGKVPTEF